MVEKPCSQCWYKGRWNTCRHPYAELPCGGEYSGRSFMRMDSSPYTEPTINPTKCGREGRLWLKLPPFFILRFRYWLMSRRQRTQWANAVVNLMQQSEENVGAETASSANVGTRPFPIRQARLKPNPYNHP